MMGENNSVFNRQIEGNLVKYLRNFNQFQISFK